MTWSPSRNHPSYANSDCGRFVVVDLPSSGRRKATFRLYDLHSWRGDNQYAYEDFPTAEAARKAALRWAERKAKVPA